MNRAAVFTSLLMAFAFCAFSETIDRTSLPAITVYTQFETAPTDISFDEMKTELAIIMDPIGLGFAWRSLPAASGKEVAAELVVVSFKGTCRMEEIYTGPRETGALGWTHMSDGEILPFTDIDCDRIRRFIAPQIVGISGGERERILGRATGRVLAHELYHILTKNTQHASWGVAKAFYTPQELVSDTFLFEGKESRALREGKVKSLLSGRRSLRNSFTGH